MYLVVIAWLYVALMMAVAEATNTTGTVLGAIVTFRTLWTGAGGTGGLHHGHAGAPQGDQGPRGGRARGRHQRAAAAASRRQMQAAKRPLTRSRRCEKNRKGLATVHQPALPSLP